jgi:hypothetical protein
MTKYTVGKDKYLRREFSYYLGIDDPITPVWELDSPYVSSKAVWFHSRGISEFHLSQYLRISILFFSELWIT